MSETVSKKEWIAMKAATNNDEWIRISQAAKRLGVCIDSTRKLIRQGRLSCRRVPGGLIRVFAADVDRVLEESTKPALPPGRARGTAVLKGASR
jgi:excisionase family DNA binding protein